MAKKKKKKKWSLRFELSPGGLVTVVTVTGCVLLWMFFLGIWAGQSVLQGGGFAAGKGRNKVQDSGGRSAATLTKSAKQPAPESGTIDRDAEPEMAADSFFAVQVAAVADRQQAIRRVLAWRVTNRDVYYTEPHGKEEKYRVFVGRFETLERANAKAAVVQQRAAGPVYIALVSEQDVRQP